MRIKFTKMHGLGNDFVMVDAISQAVSMTPERARKLANRHFGVGCDQVLVVEAPSHPENDFKYRIFNADGSEVENCGNGARCFAIFVRLRRLTHKSSIRTETAAGVLVLRITARGEVSVDMGAPIFEPGRIPFLAESPASEYALEVDGQTFFCGAVSMGNPHAVFVVDNTATAPVEQLGPLIEAHLRFPNKVNVGFMQKVNENEIMLRVFERGSGETLACGTGACAAVVSGIQRGLLNSPVKVHLPGGDLNISWAGGDGSVEMTGPATVVFHGQVRV
ncbi:MAG: diaminopimelate epimerase [Pseudomonadota bacterium]|jgi:diaminopimelate epimerase